MIAKLSLQAIQVDIFITDLVVITSTTTEKKASDKVS
jgi:hypothetical protein